MMRTTVTFYTLGCRANQYDTEMLKEQIREDDRYRIIDFTKDADVYVINTCSVTQGADSKSRKYIRRAVRAGGIVLVTGCYVTLDVDKIEEIDGVDVIFSNAYKRSFGRILAQSLRGFRGVVSNDDLVDWDIGLERISRDSVHTRGFLKVQDGCSNNCSFCKVRLLRGPVRSKPVTEAVEEAKSLGKNGYNEVVLTGVNLAEYRSKGNALVELVTELDELEDISRIRLSSINPEGVTNELVEVFRESHKTCPHFHIPLQSGSNRILKSMSRGYTAEYYLKKIELLRNSLQNVTFGTDIMVGFPGETDRDVRETEKILREVGYINVHVFRYSPRLHTHAWEYDDDVQYSDKKERSDSLRSLASSISLDVRRDYRGKQLEMIVEEKSSRVNGWRGYSKNYLDLHLRSDQCNSDLSPGKVKSVEVLNVHDNYCEATAGDTSYADKVVLTPVGERKSRS